MIAMILLAAVVVLALAATAQEQFRLALVDGLRDPGVAQALMEWYRGMDEATGKADREAAMGSYFDANLMPKIETRMKEMHDRAIAESNFVPPERAAMQRMEKPLNERQLRRDAGTDEALRHQQRLHDDLYLLWQCSPERLRGGIIQTYLEEVGAPEHIRTALDTTTATGALEWIPTILSADYYTLIDHELVIAALFPEMVMRAKTIEIPTAVGRADAYAKTEGVAVTEDASIKSAKITFTAKDLGSFRDWTTDLEQDSVLSLLPLIRAALAEGIAYGIDQIILDGDESGTHMDTTHAAITHVWDGLRHQALVNATGANADLSTYVYDNWSAIPAAMGRFANPRDLVKIVPNKVFWKKLPTLVDNATNKNPMFQVGTFCGVRAPGVPFEVHQMGIPIVMSTLVREDLGATGVNEASANTYTTEILVNKRAWRRGTRREVTVKYADAGAAEVKLGMATLAATWRGTFEHMEAAASLTTAVGIKIS